MSDVALAIRLTADADDAVRAANDVGDSWGQMALDVDDATRDADRAAGRLSGAADAADGMASSSSQAAGGIGDLGGALSLMPGPLGAVGAGMEAVAPAIMGVTGAADLANLALGSNIVQTTKARAAAVKHAVATRAQAAATRTAAIAQRVFNAAMRANPIGIAITALLLLAGLFVLAYNRSETFRNIVNAVMDRVRTAIGWVLDKVRNIPEAFAAARDKVREVLDRIREWLADLGDKLRSAGETVREAIGGAFTWIKEHTIDPVMDAIQWVIDKLGSIKPPDWLPGVGRVAVGGATTGATSMGGGVVVEEHYHFNGITPTGELELARLMDRAQARRRRVTTGR